MTSDTTTSQSGTFDPAALVAQLDALGLRLSCRRLDGGALALAPWHGAGGPHALHILTDACQNSTNRMALLAYLEQAGRSAD